MTRDLVSCSIRSSGARTQPTRSPPQKALLALPTVIVSGAYAANGRGIGCPSMASITWDSSTIGVTCARRSSAAYRSRSSSLISSPVGLWKSGIR